MRVRKGRMKDRGRVRKKRAKSKEGERSEWLREMEAVEEKYLEGEVRKSGNAAVAEMAER